VADSTIRVLVVDDNKEICTFLKAWINKEPDMVCLGVVHDGLTAVKKIVELEPDVVILDLVLPQIDGLGVLEQMEKQRVKSRFVILSAFDGEDFIERALDSGAHCFVMKPFEPASLLQRIREAALGGSTGEEWQQMQASSWQRQAVIEELIASRLTELGIPAHYKGYRYLKDGISLVIDDVELLGRVTKVLYPVIAKRNRTSPEKVERAMRHAIETAWSRGDVEVLHRTFGYSVDANRGRPTNSSFIAKLADQIRLELRTKESLAHLG
jgi:two-component system response regulator (stage 0 sporulation protein A)